MHIKLGIYCILNNINNKKYIGRTRNISKRFTSHINLLDNRHHPNKHLQNSWDLHGKKYFIFYILEECDINVIISRERYWCDYYDTFNQANGYNIGSPERGSMIGRIHTESSKLKISLANKGKIVSVKTRKKLSDANKGRKHSIETINKLRMINKDKIISEKMLIMLKTINIGRKHTPEAISNMCKSQKGHEVKESTRAKISIGQSLVQKNRTISETRKIFAHEMLTYLFISPQDKIYKIIGMRPFCKEFNLDRAAMTRVWNGKNITHKGWKKYNDDLDNKDILILDYRQ